MFGAGYGQRRRMQQSISSPGVTPLPASGDILTSTYVSIGPLHKRCRWAIITWSRSCSQLLLCTVMRASEADTLAMTLCVSAPSHSLSLPGRSDAVVRSTCSNILQVTSVFDSPQGVSSSANMLDMPASGSHKLESFMKMLASAALYQHHSGSKTVFLKYPQQALCLPRCYSNSLHTCDHVSFSVHSPDRNC